jgi:hypothetical protein
MSDAVPDCLVTGYEPLIESISLPDVDDRHVVAAAVRCGAQVIVTFNLDDFPTEELAKFNLEPQHPDDFVLSSIDISPGGLVRIVEEQAAALRNPPVEFNQLLGTLRDCGLVQSVARLRELSS